MILDDNFFFQKILEELIIRSSALELESSIQSKEDLSSITNTNPDVLFFDPEFVGESPETITEQFSNNPALVIVSANDKFTSKVFDHQVTDMLDKSTLTTDRFQITLDKIQASSTPASLSA